MAMDLDPTVLRAFVAVNEAGSFTRAAQRLHLTQSAISHQIRRLEEQVGRPLLFRTTRSLTLTEDGEEFLRYARDILDLLDALAQRFRPLRSQAWSASACPKHSWASASRRSSRNSSGLSEIRLDVNVGTYLDLRAMVKDKQLDLAVAISVPDLEAFTGENGETVLRRSQFTWVASESFAFGAAPRSQLPSRLPLCQSPDRDQSPGAHLP